METENNDKEPEFAVKIFNGDEEENRKPKTTL